jgi:hypothetical protein
MQVRWMNATGTRKHVKFFVVELNSSGVTVLVHFKGTLARTRPTQSPLAIRTADSYFALPRR